MDAIVSFVQASPVLSATVGGAVAAPVALSLALPAVGFTSTGIAAGSTAAWMMSQASGVIGGAAVVAACQSAGAAGLGATYTALTAVGGAWIGQQVATTAKMIVDRCL